MENSIHLISDVLKTIDDIIRAIDINSKKQIHKIGMTWNQFLVLKEMNNDRKMTATKLVDNLGLSQFKVTCLVDGLLKKELITRSQSESDKRAWNLELSAHGLSALEAVLRQQNEFVARFNNLPYWHQNQILSSLQHLEEMINNKHSKK